MRLETVLSPFSTKTDLCPEPWAKLILALGYFLLSWLFLWFLYKKKVFLKV